MLLLLEYHVRMVYNVNIFTYIYTLYIYINQTAHEKLFVCLFVCFQAMSYPKSRTKNMFILGLAVPWTWGLAWLSGKL